MSARPMSPATLRRLMRSKVAADAAPEERIALWTLRLLKAAGAL